MIILIRIFSILLMLLTLCNCQTIETRGQHISDDLLPQLESKRLNKSEVEDIVGTPTVISSYDPNVWYYIQRSLSKRVWFEPKVIEQRVVKLVFDKNNIVAEVMVLDNMHKDNVNVVSEYTKTYGTELNGIQKFIRNIGRFNKTIEENNRRRKSNK